jgi:hypothetical protein
VIVTPISKRRAKQSHIVWNRCGKAENLPWKIVPTLRKENLLSHIRYSANKEKCALNGKFIRKYASVVCKVIP